MISIEQLSEHAQQIRDSGVLGTRHLLKLFDFFVDCACNQRVPKEIEVALDVFGKKVDFDVAQDAMVRVYAYRLRRKLDEYYAGIGRSQRVRLVLIKGEYRLNFIDQPTPPSVAPRPQPTLITPPGAPADKKISFIEWFTATLFIWRRHWPIVLASAILAANVAGFLFLMARPLIQGDSPESYQLRGNPIWAGMLDDDLPIFIVLGDYYIFGELNDSSMGVQRLVREFKINSPIDLEQHLKDNPQLAGHYMDLSLQYLPTSIAFGLRNLMPILEPNNKGKRKLMIILASDLTPLMVRSGHIIYLGLISGMGRLSQFAFDDSRFAIGDSFDEIKDLQTRKRYISQAGMGDNAARGYTDYGYFSTRTSPRGNELVILAGTRDVALMHVTEMATQQASLVAVSKQADATANFEALFSVQAVERTNLEGHLLISHKFDTAGRH